MPDGWVGADEVLSTYADDLDDPRAIEEAERIRRAQERADAVVRHVLSQQREGSPDDDGYPDLDDDLEDAIEDDLDEGYL